MSRKATLAVAAIVLAVVLGVTMAAVRAQDQPKAPAVPGEGAEIKIPDPKAPEVPKKALDAEDPRLAKRAIARERMPTDPRVQMASLYARSLASQPAIAVAGEHVYVVKGDTLFQFSVNGLQLLATAQLEDPAVTAARKAKADAALIQKLEWLRADKAAK